MNERILRLAQTQAKCANADLFIVAAWQGPFSDSESDDLSQPGRINEAVREQALANLESLQRCVHVRVPSTQVTFKSGLASQVILETVSDLQPDLLIMGTIMLSGIPGVWIGNTADEVVRQVECALLTAKPNDFEFKLPQGLEG
jgi:nucleotide-binding universal stress UspA family protein